VHHQPSASQRPSNNLGGMSDHLALGRVVRVARHRRRKRQEDVAAEAGVARRVVVDIEHGRLDNVRLGELISVGRVLELRLPLDWKQKREDLHDLTDTGHAALVEAAVRLLHGAGWDCRVEAISGSGSIDVFAFHPTARMLLVVEIKTRLVDLQRTLRELGYRTAAARSAAMAFGWAPVAVSTLLVIGATSAQRRLVGRHAAVFATAFPLQGRAARAWLTAPLSAARALVFMSYGHRQHGIQHDTVRVRLTKREIEGREAIRQRPERGRGGNRCGSG
jgi:transcriptional regulator with XRE-family HTH domain